ncbi:M20 family metallo-hydrolase [Bacillus sp. UNC438CL73TsuS30]|uniref:M20 family metallo-hydrolase n=1 Tax=Bacillus sp. UNC438CL73TsuS30 TaxID=1340434 RepID=UPI000478F3F1|nr:M20 family metallo-hydrolase [Bacillus sp. UNC438CL73TsuS30]
MKINIERLFKDLDRIVTFTKTPGKGCTRFSFSSEDRQAREYLLTLMKELDLSIKVDGFGNIRATYGKNINLPPILIGSHIDTVANGGKYDGLLGVLAALETIRVLKEENAELTRPVELIIFSEEEGSNFGVTMMGSKVMTGKYSLSDLKSIKNSEGKSCYDIVKNFGLGVDHIEQETVEQDEIAAMIELHIEQGAVLETENKTIGIVQAIAGMKTFKVTLEGDSNHAGTTPMDLRSDPMVGAASIIADLQRTVKSSTIPTTVATVGKISCEPNLPNVIPQKVKFFVDARDVEMKGIDFVTDYLVEKVSKVAKEHSLISQIELVGQSQIKPLSPRIMNVLEQEAIAAGFSYKKMNSGAVHDAALMTDVTDVGMIFIPSLKGKSHCPDEFSKVEDIEAGSQLLLKAVASLAVKKHVIQEK